MLLLSYIPLLHQPYLSLNPLDPMPLPLYLLLPYPSGAGVMTDEMGCSKCLLLWFEFIKTNWIVGVHCIFDAFYNFQD